MKISLILPLYDRRKAGWKALESALHQTLDRTRYEVIAVGGRALAGELASEPGAAALLQQCDAVVHLDADPDRLDQEIPFLLAGYAKSTGDLLVFLEGHTVLQPDACAGIAAHFRDNPRSQLAWATRIHRSESPLGLLIGMHSKEHERRAAARGGFWLGGNCVIARDLYERLGGLDASYLRFCERVFLERVLREGIAIGRLGMPLSIHYDDMALSHLMDVAGVAGAAKSRYYNAPIPAAGRVKVRHWVYSLANRGGMALLAYPLCCALRSFFMHGAIGLCRFSRAWAYRFYVLGFGFADLAGFCRERIRVMRVSPATAAPLAQEARP